MFSGKRSSRRIAAASPRAPRRRRGGTLPPARALAGLLALLLLAPGAAPADEFIAPAPEDLVIYQVLIDRFDNGDRANDRANPRASFDPAGPASFHGGDFAGIARRLDYIRGLGANALWITPVLENVDGYHGYHTYDWYAIEPSFGTREELVALVHAAHDHGIAVYLDMVAGHCGDLLRSSDPGYPRFRGPAGSYRLAYRTGLRYPPPFDDPVHFNAHGHIDRFEGEEQELGELLGLDDLRTTSPFVRAQMTAIWSHWLEQLPIDGFRIDTVKHIEVGFWEEFLPALAARAAALGRSHYFTFGEIYGADDATMRRYLGSLDGGPHKLDGALDFPFHYVVTDVFARQTHPPRAAVDRLLGRAAAVGPHHLRMVNFIDNHDLRRFLGATQDRPGAGLGERLRRLDLALVFLMTAPGIPVIYYGTEQGFDGGNDPYNREDMFDGDFEFGPSLGDNFDDSSRWYRLLRRLARLRHALPALRRGSLQPILATEDGPGLLVFRRGGNGDELPPVVVMLNTASSPMRVPAFDSGWSPGLVVVNGLSPAQRITVGTDRMFPAHILPAQGAEVWLADQDMPPAIPEVVATQPADGETGVSLATSIVLDFSTPMDRPATEGALRLSPPLAGTTSWDDTSTRLTFRPDTPLAERAAYRLTLGEGARTAYGAALEATPAVAWRTGRQPRSLPPLPPLRGEIRPTSRALTLDGRGDDWGPLPDGGLAEADLPHFGADGVFTWIDAAEDDVGHGSYAYPTDASFTGGDADLRVVRVAFDDRHLHLHVQVASVSPNASFFTPYVGIALDTAPGGRTGPLGYDQRDRTNGDAQLVVRPDAAPEFEVVFSGPRGANLLTVEGEAIEGAEGRFSQETGEIELRLDRAALGLADLGDGRDISLVVYAGLETFGTLREIAPTVQAWLPGGGSSDLTDPDVFDLAGAGGADQRTELGDFDRDTPAMVTHSLLRIRLLPTAPAAVPAAPAP